MASRRMGECLEHALQVVEFGLAPSNGHCGRFAAMFSQSANSRQVLFSNTSNHSISSVPPVIGLGDALRLDSGRRRAYFRAPFDPVCPLVADRRSGMP